MISEKALEQFKKIWKEKFNEEISDDLAMDEAVNLLTMFNAVFRPLKKTWLKEYKYDNATNSDNNKK